MSIQRIRLTHPALNGGIVLAERTESGTWVLLACTWRNGRQTDPLPVLQEAGLSLEYRDEDRQPVLVDPRGSQMARGEVPYSYPAEGCGPAPAEQVPAAAKPKKAEPRFVLQGFRRTGEIRPPRKGEWFVGLAEQAQQASFNYGTPYLILERRGMKARLPEPPEPKRLLARVRRKK